MFRAHFGLRAGVGGGAVRSWRRGNRVNLGSSPVMDGNCLLLMSDCFSVLGLTDISFLFIISSLLNTSRHATFENLCFMVNVLFLFVLWNLSVFLLWLYACNRYLYESPSSDSTIRLTHPFAKQIPWFLSEQRRNHEQTSWAQALSRFFWNHQSPPCLGISSRLFSLQNTTLCREWKMRSAFTKGA